MTLLLEPFQYIFFQQAFIATILALTALALASPTVVANGQSFFSHGISQSMVLGIAVASGASLFGILGAIVAALLAATTIYAFQRLSWIPKDAVIAVVASGFFALGIIVINMGPPGEIQVNDVLFGNILGVSFLEIIVLGGLAFASATLFGVLGNKMLACAQNSEVALARGINVSALEIARLIALALVTAITVPIVGALLVVAAITLPALIGFSLQQNLTRTIVVSVVSSVFAGIVALFVSYFADIPTGPSIVIVLILTWLGVLAVVPRSRTADRSL